ncbi:hypothetical protein P3472_23050 [Vibrio parahaemolyticus]|nr:hypothetical protein [Vibrio parahaemolyticus]
MSEQLLIPKQEDCYIDYDDGQGNNFALKIKFEETDEKDEKGERASSFRVEPQSDYLYQLAWYYGTVFQ